MAAAARPLRAAVWDAEAQSVDSQGASPATTSDDEGELLPARPEERVALPTLVVCGLLALASAMLLIAVRSGCLGVAVLGGLGDARSLWSVGGASASVGGASASVVGTLTLPGGDDTVQIRLAPPAAAGGEHLQQASWLDHYAQDCWAPCKGAGLCEEWCGAGRACCRFNSPSDPPECAGSRPTWPSWTFHVCVAAAEPTLAAEAANATAAPPAAPPAAPLAEAPTFTFYLYRAQNDEDQFTLGNVNIANLPGVMWYLSNEVMPRCPRRYGISRIRRYLITTRATPELFARGMNFGIRYSYDAGRCTGSNIRWIGHCSDTWDRFGYVPGCNNFRDHYPYPLVDTEYPDGVWYDLPLEGRCSEPTGAWNCTWSYKEAGEIRLDDLEAREQGMDYCCGGKCTGFWRGHWTPSDCDRRLAQVQALFAERYPSLPAELPPPACDFHQDRFWA